MTNPTAAQVIAFLVVVGFVILIAAVFYEGWFAKVPIVPGRFLRNTTVLCAGLIGFFDFISFYLQFTYREWACDTFRPNLAHSLPQNIPSSMSPRSELIASR